MLKWLLFVCFIEELEMEENIKKIKAAIRDVPDFPKKGILFRDITTALKDSSVLKITIDELYENFKNEFIIQNFCHKIFICLVSFQEQSC